jgi:hypothetical protein
MPSAGRPRLGVRFSKEELVQLRELSVSYGSPTMSDFVRELVGAVISGDPSAVMAFVNRLVDRVGGQMALNVVVDYTPQAAQTAQKPQMARRTVHLTRSARKKRKTRRTLKPRDRTT